MPRQAVPRLPMAPVALRKESVDRNSLVAAVALRFQGSLSARRAWIEIFGRPVFAINALVALRKESVDRNDCIDAVCVKYCQSLSARRAWIEMRKTHISRHV